MRAITNSILPSLLTALMLAALIGGASATASSSSAWQVIESPSPSGLYNALAGVATLSPNNVWAVGAFAPSAGVYQTLVEHWDGATWAVVPSPNAGATYNSLRAVAAVSSNDIWAVGGYTNSRNIGRTLIERWNGVTWAVIPSPSIGKETNDLHAVAAIAASDVWAAGEYIDLRAGRYQTLLEHWDGRHWSVVPSPSPGAPYNFLDGIAATGPDDVWAVGHYSLSETSPFQTLIEHWNGVAWSVVSSPNPGAGHNLLRSIAAFSPSDIWAVGDYADTGPFQTLVEHWNGVTWSVVRSPNAGTGDNTLFAVATDPTSGSLWAVGQYYSDPAGPAQTLIERSDGKHWRVVASPNVGSGDNTLLAVAISPSGDNWAVGDYTAMAIAAAAAGNPIYTLTERSQS